MGAVFDMFSEGRQRQGGDGGVGMVMYQTQETHTRQQVIDSSVVTV